MSSTVMRVENLSKQYRIGTLDGYKTFRESLIDAAKVPLQHVGAVTSKALSSPLCAPCSLLPPLCAMRRALRSLLSALCNCVTNKSNETR
jgi:hypothetical protein